MDNPESQRQEVRAYPQSHNTSKETTWFLEFNLNSDRTSAMPDNRHCPVCFQDLTWAGPHEAVAHWVSMCGSQCDNHGLRLGSGEGFYKYTFMCLSDIKWRINPSK